MSLNLIEKYRVEKYSEIIGQETIVSEIEKFLKEFPKKKGLLLHGPAGSGKTSLVIASAKENNLEIFELNASDLRNRLKLEEVLKPASQQSSLFKKGKILLMDEIDGVTGTDIGGVSELIRITDKTSHPIIMTGNDIWHTKFSDLRKVVKLVEVKPLSIDKIVSILSNIAQKEKISESQHFLRQIAIKSQGDVRAAINDFQIHCIEGGSDFNYLENRNKEKSIFDIIKLIFQDRGDFLDLFDNTKMSLDEILLWIEENIPRVYQKEALAKAFISLSNADRFRGRIYRQQFWRFLEYQNIFQSAGIAYAKKQPIRSFVKYERPQRILKIWLSNQKNVKKKTIAQKYAKYAHCSLKRALADFPLITKIVKNNPDVQAKIKFSDEEIDFLNK